MLETQKIIDHVPTQEELMGAALPPVNEVNGNAINLNDTTQRAEFNTALIANGVAPRVAPSGVVSIKVPETPIQPLPDTNGVETYIPSELERKIPRAELKKMADLIMWGPQE